MLLVAAVAYRWSRGGGAPGFKGRGTVPAGVVPVRVVRTARGYRLERGGAPYFVRGGAGLQQFAALRAAGGNSVRLWSADYADVLLDEAQRQGLTVTLGLWMQIPQEGFDYYNKEDVQQQLVTLRQQVLRFRRHPALLMWDVGNELDQSKQTAEAFRAVEEVARMVHELDPYHPVCTTVSGSLQRVPDVQQLCPSVDLLGVNTYSRLLTLGHDLRAQGWARPYLVTEFGCQGYWESPHTPWKVPLEQNSTAKAAYVQTRYERGILADPARCLGGYAFFWGHKEEGSPTWFSLFGPSGEKTSTVDALQQLWTGRAPANRAPSIGPLQLAGRYDADSVRLPAGARCPAVVTAADPEQDALYVRWEVRPETPTDAQTEMSATMAEPVPNAIEQAQGLRAQVRIPAKPGPYRLFVRVYDGHGSVATANLPFFAQPKAGPTGPK